MEYTLLFFVVFFAIIVATIQDLKRREVDNWLNYGLLCFGIVYIVYHSLFISNISFLYNGLALIGIGFVLHYMFYFGRVFAGGDAKLLFALSPYFTHASFFDSVFSYIIFIFLMFLCGGIYGTVYSFVLYVRNFKPCNAKIYSRLRKMKFLWFLLFGIIFIVFGYFYEYIFVLLGILIIVFPLLISFAKGVESVVMIRLIHGKNLREGDWLVSDVRVGKHLVKASFEGVSQANMKLLKHTAKVKIKDGLPFVPAFLFAIVLYHMYWQELLQYLLRLFLFY